MEQLNAMLFVIQRQPYVIANYSKEMADIAESFAKKESSISGNDIAELYDDLMDGLFDKVPSLINKMTTVTTERVSRHGIYS